MFIINIIALIVVPAISALPYPQNKHEIWLDEDYFFAWEIRENIIAFECIVKTQGWVGMGISTDGQMDGADFAISGFNDAGNIYGDDFHGVGNKLELDKEENWWYLTFDNSTDTYVTFIRYLDTEDYEENEDVPIQYEPIYVMWAFSYSDEVNESYVKRGSYRVNLLNPS